MSTGAAPPDYPLIALSVAIETGQPVDVADAFLTALQELPPSTELVNIGSSGTGIARPFHHALTTAINADRPDISPKLSLQDKSPGLEAALLKVHELRGQRLVVEDALRAARLARRYSFNRYR